jgi:flotillin
MNPDDPGTVVAVLGLGAALVVSFLVFIALLRRFLFICGPHEIVVFSGRRHTLPDGTEVNYKILQGGRGFRMPFLELAARMDMRLFPVEVTVQNAYSKSGIPLTVRAIANVKLASDAGILRNAVERFLDATPHQISETARQTLEGVLREVISGLTPEEVNEDRLKFADSLVQNARDDFDKLGFELDVLKVQHVADDAEYLKNLGRARIANMLRDAENAENAANQTVAEAKAEARQNAETASKNAEITVVQAKNNADGETATLAAQALEAENQAAMAVETARSRAEQRLQELRAELEKLRLHCDVVLPAEAQRKAGAEALRMVATEWAHGGDAAREVYVLQQLRSLVEAAAERVQNSHIGNIKLVAGDDKALSTVLSSYPAAVGSVLRETGAALGIDMDKLLSRSSASADDGRGSAKGGAR